MGELDGAAELHVAHGHNHISELTHALIGIELGRRIFALRQKDYAAAPAASWRVTWLRNNRLMNHLDQLESESVYILREAFNRIDKLAMLWSLGKDSNVMVWLAKKAFFGHVPFPVMHIDTGKKFPEMYAFRDRYAANGTST